MLSTLRHSECDDSDPDCGHAARHPTSDPDCEHVVRRSASARARTNGQGNESRVNALAIVDAMVHTTNWVFLSGHKHAGARVQPNPCGIIGMDVVIDGLHESILHEHYPHMGAVRPTLLHSFKFLANMNMWMSQTCPPLMPAMIPLDFELLYMLLAAGATSGQPQVAQQPENQGSRARKRSLIATAWDIKKLYWAMWNGRQGHNFRDKSHRYQQLPEPFRSSEGNGHRFELLNNGYRSNCQCKCRWFGVVTVRLSQTGTLGCLIATDPCETCGETGDSTHETQVYLSELMATSGLLREALILAGWTKNFNQATGGKSQHRPEHKPINAVVINMTPNRVRVIESTVLHPAEPRVHMFMRDQFAHDLNNADHTNQEPGQLLSCPECCEILSWLHFTIPDDDHDPDCTCGRQLASRSAHTASVNRRGRVAGSSAAAGDDDHTERVTSSNGAGVLPEDELK